METGPTSENSCHALVDFLCTHLGCNSVELKLTCRTGLGLREARSRACTKSPFRRLVRLVRRVRDIIVQAKLAGFRRLKYLVRYYESISAILAMILVADSAHSADADRKPLDEQFLGI